MTEEKKKIFVISDHPLAPSGVGTQTKYFIEALLATGRYKFVCLGGAVKHNNYEPQKIDPWGDDFIVYPVKGYGSQEMVRSALFNENPDVIWFMTDPRFYQWLWSMDNEIRVHCPMIYYHVWDNYPLPMYNKKYYESNDVIASISKVTHDIVNNVAPDVENHYLPHAVDSNVFVQLADDEIEDLKQKQYGEDADRLTFFWNNRNARRKMSGSLIYWFNEFAEEVGPENVRLLMHTDPNDPNGQSLTQIISDLGIDDGRVLLSTKKVNPSVLAAMYNMSDCTINISDAEGFGLATLESLSCGTPIIVNMTGGLQEQVTDGDQWFGVGIEPASKAIIGSQQVPYIYEDRANKESVVNALKKVYNMSKEERKLLGMKGRSHVIKNYNFDSYRRKWVKLIDNVIENHGSWENRNNYKAWNFLEVK